MIDILVLLLCAIAAIMGWRRGALLTALPLAAMVTGYAAAVFLYRPLGTPLMDRFGIPAIPAYAAGGVMAFLATAVAFRALGWWIRRRQSRPDVEFFPGDGEDDAWDEPEPRERGVGPSPASRYGGTVLGAAWAFGVAMILVWGVESVAALAGSTGARKSVTARLGGRAVGSVAYVLVDRKTGDDFTASTAAALFRDPAAFTELADGLLGDEAFRGLLSDPELPALLAEGRVEELAGRPELQRLLDDPEFLRMARKLGVTEGVDAGSAEAMARALSDALGPVAAAVTALRNDPRVMETVRELDLSSRLESGGVTSLLGDREILAVAAQVANALERQDR